MLPKDVFCPHNLKTLLRACVARCWKQTLDRFDCVDVTDNVQNVDSNAIDCWCTFWRAIVNGSANWNQHCCQLSSSARMNTKQKYILGTKEFGSIDETSCVRHQGFHSPGNLQDVSSVNSLKTKLTKQKLTGYWIEEFCYCYSYSHKKTGCGVSHVFFTEQLDLAQANKPSINIWTQQRRWCEHFHCWDTDAGDRWTTNIQKRLPWSPITNRRVSLSIASTTDFKTLFIWRNFDVISECSGPYLCQKTFSVDAAIKMTDALHAVKASQNKLHNERGGQWLN